MKRFLAFLLALCLLAGLLPAAVAAEETVIFDAANMLGFRRTRDEVLRRYNEAIGAGGGYTDRDSATYYARTPSLSAPYDQGELKQDTLDAMIAMTNYLRWLSGAAPLKAGAANDDGLQRAALIRNFHFSHTVSDDRKPADMDQEFWDSGKVWHNILAWNYTPRGAINGWCNEGYSLRTQSWDTTGHRSALLSSDVSEVSFGYAGAIAVGRDDKYENVMTNPFTAYPAPGPVLTELIYAEEAAWTVQLNDALFAVPDASALTVTVTDCATGEAYVCTRENGKLSGSLSMAFVQPAQESYLNSRYYNDGSSYRVQITGLTELSTGKPAELRYQVDFFSGVAEMATTVTECRPPWGTTLYVPSGLRDAGSLEKLTAALPQTVVAETQTGREYEVPVVGGWTYDAEQKCWTAGADAAALPEHVKDPGGKLARIQISLSEEYGYTGYFRVGSSSQILLGKPGTITVNRYMLGTPQVYVCQLRPDGTVVVRYTEGSENCVDSGSLAEFSIESWTAEDSGTWFAIYGVDWIGGFVVGFQDVTVTCLHEHTTEDRTEPTCTEAGSADVICEICGTQLLHEELPALGHAYQSAVTEATCTEGGGTKYTCTRCGDSYITEQTEALGHAYQSAVTEATCTEDGYTTHTCARCGDSCVTDPVEALGHDWDAPTYVWSADYLSCTAEAVCGRDASHRRTETVPSSAESETASCTQPGTVTFAAAFEDPMFAAQTITVEGVPLGHAFSAWETVRAATCLEPGLRRGTCTRCGETAEEPIPATGHAWAEPTYDWSADNGTVTARCVCGNDASHIETETVQTTQRVTREATYDEEGEIVFTAEFQNAAFSVQTKAIPIPKPERPVNPFVDVGAGKYYYDAVLWAVVHQPQITNGLTDVRFGPDEPCTRGHVVTFLWRAAGTPAPESADNPFTDVAKGKFYYNAVLWAVEKGVTKGVSETSFAPDDTCTRGQVVTFLWRAVGQPKTKLAEASFTDVSAGAYYYKAMLWAVENDVTKGMTATTFAPDGVCTRGQVVTFLHRTFA